MPVLRVTSAARSPQPLVGASEVVAAQVALRLDLVRERLEEFRSRLARFSTPPLGLTGPQAERAAGEHARFLCWSALVADIDRAIERNEDITCDEGSPLAVPCWRLIINQQFTEAMCSACARSYGPGECEVSEWSLPTGRAGLRRASIGGSRLSCPAGHVLVVCQNWIA